MTTQFYARAANTAEAQTAKWLAASAVVIGAIAALIWTLIPDLDLQISRSLYRGSNLFVGNEQTAVTLLRNILIIAFFATAFAATAIAIHLHLRGGTRFGLDKFRWLFIALCMGLGPGVVTNLIIKDQIGRARPKSVIEFGGDRTFSPPLTIAGQCTRSCSFVSGEASSSFVIFYAAAIAAPQAATALIIVGTAVGLLTGFVRMLQGAHFLSDVVFAGVFMALTVASAYFALRALDIWIRRRWPNLIGPGA
jgi:lipid A 4'-phosphatase